MEALTGEPSEWPLPAHNESPGADSQSVASAVLIARRGGSSPAFFAADGGFTKRCRESITVLSRSYCANLDSRLARMVPAPRSHTYCPEPGRVK